MKQRYRFTLIQGGAPGTNVADAARRALECWVALKPRERSFRVLDGTGGEDWLLAEIADDGDEDSPCEDLAEFFTAHGLECATTEVA